MDYVAFENFCEVVETIMGSFNDKIYERDDSLTEELAAASRAPDNTPCYESGRLAFCLHDIDGEPVLDITRNDGSAAVSITLPDGLLSDERFQRFFFEVVDAFEELAGGK